MSKKPLQQDNSTYLDKIAIRRAMLREVEQPVVLETHGGYGKLYQACYRDVAEGVVFDKDARKAEALALQRPTWAVYEADCVQALHQGAGAHLEVNVLDLDPYGEPWPAIDAFFESERPRAERLWVVVNDGLRQICKEGRSWATGSLQGIVERYGNGLYAHYLEVCRELLTEKAAQVGYTLDRFVGRCCGHARQMTHYLAAFHR